MVSRCKYQSSSEIGAYARITNTFALLPITTSDQFTSAFDNLLTDNVKIVRTNIAGTAIVGRLTVANSRGLIVPLTTTRSELQHLRDSLPDGVEVALVEERYSALGNVISCNDKIAIVHPDLDPETIEVIEDVLQVEAFPATIANEPLVGSYSVFTNRGGVVTPDITREQLEELSGQLGVTLEAATVNQGSNLVSAGVCVNDSALICGWDSTALEVANLTRIFKIDDNAGNAMGDMDVDDGLLDLIF